MNQLTKHRLVILALCLYILADLYKKKLEVDAETQKPVPVSTSVTSPEFPEEAKMKKESELIGKIRSNTEWSNFDKILFFWDEDRFQAKIKRVDNTEIDPSPELKKILLEYHTSATSNSEISQKDVMITISRIRETGGTKVTFEDKSILTL